MTRRARLTGRNAIRSVAIAMAALSLAACEGHGDHVSQVAHLAPRGPEHGEFVRQVAHLEPHPHKRAHVSVVEHSRADAAATPVRQSAPAGQLRRAQPAGGQDLRPGRRHEPAGRKS